MVIHSLSLLPLVLLILLVVLFLELFQVQTDGFASLEFVDGCSRAEEEEFLDLALLEVTDEVDGESTAEED